MLDKDWKYSGNTNTQVTIIHQQLNDYIIGYLQSVEIVECFYNNMKNYVIAGNL